MAEISVRLDMHTLYREHHGWLTAWLCRRIGCVHNAADLAQDTFARLLVSRDISSVREPRAYLTTVAKGLMVNWSRRQSLERAYLEALALLPEPHVPSPEHRLVILETLGEIDAMLDAMAPKAKRAFLLSQIEGMKYEEIARSVGVSVGSVKRYMQEGFRRCLMLMA